MRVLSKMNYATKCFLELTGSHFTLPRASLSQAIAALILAVFAVSTLAEKGDGILDSGEDRQEELARAAQNPIASLISLTIQNNTNFDYGPREKTQNVTNVQPVIPFSVSENWNVITRTIVPIVSQPGFVPGQDRENGLGNILFSSFLSPKDTGKWIWGAGLAVQLPTSTDDQIAPDEWAAGPSVVLLTMPGNWVMGGLVSNIWDISADESINFMSLQPFLNYNFEGGWYLTSSPILTANWEADDEWTVPVGGGFGRVFRVGEQPVNTQLQAFYNVVKPDDIGPEWTLRLQLQFLFPK
jgi:hypothetical protein